MVFSFSPFNSGKKAQGMSLNVIIIAIIVLIVMVVLIVILTGKTKMFSSQMASCEAKGATCEVSCAPGAIKQFGTDCGKNEDGKTSCCMPFETTASTAAKPAAAK